MTGLDAIRFSLVMATMDRTHEVRRFVESLLRQQVREVELIVVDQNADSRLAGVLEEYSSGLHWVRVDSQPGLSRARNRGLLHARGAIIAFPDDDCIYPETLLRTVARILDSHPEFDALTGRVVGEDGKDYARFDRAPGELSALNAWRRASSVSLFVRRHVVERVGGFDETLGLGAGTPWGGGEDIDYPLRAIEAGFSIRYEPTIRVLHPNPLGEGYHVAAERARRYGAGVGRVWRKHGLPLWFVAYNLARPLAGAGLSVVSGRIGKATYHWSAFRGRLAGWLAPMGTQAP
jgi:GT2 family glycosyltransferase